MTPNRRVTWHIERRKFGVANSCAAQQPGKLPTIGLVGGAIPSTQGVWITAFVQRLRELGWIENRAALLNFQPSPIKLVG
jgi:hypothetical protein